MNSGPKHTHHKLKVSVINYERPTVGMARAGVSVSDGPGSETSKSKCDVYARASVCGCDGGEVVVVVVVVVVGGVIGSLHQSPHLGVFSSR